MAMKTRPPGPARTCRAADGWTAMNSPGPSGTSASSTTTVRDTAASEAPPPPRDYAAAQPREPEAARVGQCSGVPPIVRGGRSRPELMVARYEVITIGGELAVTSTGVPLSVPWMVNLKT
jgi:hypothetical protein